MKFSSPWLQILFFGSLLFIGSEQALRLTGNPNFFPTVLMLGSFTIPIAFVAFFYEHVRHREISMPLLSSCFLVGGVIGSIAAGVLEYRTLQTLNIPGLFAVSLIEEGVKLAFPIAVYIGWRYRHEADGLLFGVAAGMGFAALETMGYGLVAFFRSNGDFNILQQVMILRGFLSPAGHAAWTGYVCAMLWRERERKGHVVINGTVILAFFVAVLLHTLWNIVNNLGGPAATQLTIVIIGNIAVAGVSLILVLRRFFEARKLAAQYDV